MKNKTKISRQVGDVTTLIIERDMELDVALDIGFEEAKKAKDPLASILVHIPQEDVTISFSKTETEVLMCVNGKPHEEFKL